MLDGSVHHGALSKCFIAVSMKRDFVLSLRTVISFCYPRIPFSP
uniref:Uncharacterized protein n=1 Tax=Anguilla anguilla TaxID=7936 RepID=A0A0E9PXU5_ANGAN